MCAPSARDLALERARQRHRRLDAAFDGHGPEARRAARRPRRARGREHHGLAVGRPALHDVAARMPRQPLRLAALGRHDVDVDVAAVLGAERDPLAVGRELRIGRRALEARDAPRHAAGALDGPDVVGVGERDVRGADGRRAAAAASPQPQPEPARHGQAPARRRAKRTTRSRTRKERPRPAGNGARTSDTSGMLEAYTFVYRAMS